MQRLRVPDAIIAVVDDDLSAREGVSSLIRSAGGNRIHRTRLWVVRRDSHQHELSFPFWIRRLPSADVKHFVDVHAARPSTCKSPRMSCRSVW